MNVQVLGDDVVYGFDWMKMVPKAFKRSSVGHAAPRTVGARTSSGGWAQGMISAAKATQPTPPRRVAQPTPLVSPTQKAAQPTQLDFADAMLQTVEDYKRTSGKNPLQYTEKEWAWLRGIAQGKLDRQQHSSASVPQTVIGDDIDATYDSGTLHQWSALAKARSGMFGDDVVYGGENVFTKFVKGVRDTIQTPGGTAAIVAATSLMSPTQKATLAELQAAMGITPQVVSGVSQTSVITPAPWLDTVKSAAPYVLLGGAALFAVVMLTKKKRSAPAAA